MAPYAAVEPERLRARARRLIDIADAADHAAGHFIARAVLDASDRESDEIGAALVELCRDHRTVGQALLGHAATLDEARQRRAALDELVAAAQRAPGAEGEVLSRVQELRDELVQRIELEVEQRATRCARVITAVTPTPPEARRSERLLATALARAGERLIDLVGPAPSPRLAS